MVLIGSDIHELPPRGRSPAVLVGLNGDGDRLWHLAAALGAERVAVLPEAATWLAEYLSRVPDTRAGRTGPWDCRRLRRRRGHHGRDLAGPCRRPGGCACPARGRRPVGRGTGTGARRRRNGRASAGRIWPMPAARSIPASSPIPCPWPGVSRSSPGPGTKTAQRSGPRRRGRSAGRRPARLRAGGRGHRPGTRNPADFRLGLRPDDRRCPRSAAGRRGNGSAPAGPSAGGDRCSSCGANRGPRWMPG